MRKLILVVTFCITSSTLFAQHIYFYTNNIGGLVGKVKIFENDKMVASIGNDQWIRLDYDYANNKNYTLKWGLRSKKKINLNLSSKDVAVVFIKLNSLFWSVHELDNNNVPMLIVEDYNKLLYTKQTQERIVNHPKTNWTKKSLKQHWGRNGYEEIEGIYENFGGEIHYELGVIKDRNEFKIVNLSSASNHMWEIGDLKANLSKTATYGVFKTKWYMLDKSINDFLTVFDKSSMKLFSETNNNEEIYLKVFPTYEEGNNSSNSEWKGTGTGFFIDKNGYLVTNYHVIGEGKIFEVSITKNRKSTEFKAEIVSVDKQNDLAILKIIGSDFKPLENLHYNFNTQTQDVGSSVFALGYPLTQIMGNEIKFTDGKISSKSGFQGDITTYQISVPIQPGNSGGPLFDEKGNLVGITSSGINKQLADNANYAIKTSYLKLLIDSTNDRIELPNSIELKNRSLTDQIKTLSEYVVLIKVK